MHFHDSTRSLSSHSEPVFSAKNLFKLKTSSLKYHFMFRFVNLLNSNHTAFAVLSKITSKSTVAA